MRFYSIVNDGKIATNIAQGIRNRLIEMEGQKVVIEIKKGGRRSTNQNAFYWGVVIPCVQDLFLSGGATVTPEEVHCYLKEHVLGMVKMMVLPDGTRHSIVETSINLTTVKWEENIEKVRAWAAQWNMQIPFPNEHEFNQIYLGEYNG